MSISLRGTLASAFSTVSGSAPGTPAGVAAWQTYDDVAKTSDAVLFYANAPGGRGWLISNTSQVAQNGPSGIDSLAAEISRPRKNAGDALTPSPAAWAWAAVSFQGFRQPVLGSDWDQLLPYDSDYRDGRPLAGGVHQVQFASLPVRVADTLAILTVAYSGPDTAGKIDPPAGWAALPEVTGGAPGETQRTAIAFYRVVDCSAGSVSVTLSIRPGGQDARYFASLILAGLVPTNGSTGALSPSLCTLPAVDPSVAMPAAGSKRGWYSVDFAFGPGKELLALACPSAASDDYGRLWFIRWNGDYPPVPETPVEILTSGVYGAGLLVMPDRRLLAFYTLAASPNRLRYRRSTDGGVTWEAEVQVLDGGGTGSALGASHPTITNNAPALSALPGGLLLESDFGDGANSKHRLLKWNDGSGQWEFLAFLADPGGSGETFAEPGETLQLLPDRSVLRARSASTLRRYRGVQDDASYAADVRQVTTNLPILNEAWLSTRNGMLATVRSRSRNAAHGTQAMFFPQCYSWRVLQPDTSELYAVTGYGAEDLNNIGDLREWEAPASFVWDPVNLIPYGLNGSAYPNSVCRLRTDKAGLWWLLRPGPDGGLRFARGRRLSDWGTMAWEGKQ